MRVCQAGGFLISTSPEVILPVKFALMFGLAGADTEHVSALQFITRQACAYR
jgi:hypothetical protein